MYRFKFSLERPPRSWHRISDRNLGIPASEFYVLSEKRASCNFLSDEECTQMLQYQTRAGILPNPCNCGFFGNEGLQRISLYVKSRFCLETHAANSQRCRCKALRHPALLRDAFRRGNCLLQICRPSTPAWFRYCFFATGGLRRFVIFQV